MGNNNYTTRKNMRYIKTKVDDTPKILHMITCNLCPLMKFDTFRKITECAKFHSIRTSVTDDNVYSYSVHQDRYIPIKEINIPDWCGLSEGESLVKATGDMYVRNGHNSYEVVPHIYQNLVVVTGLYVSYDLKLEKLVSGSNKNGINFRYNRNSLLPATTETSFATTTTNPSIPTLSTCSCCGELKEDVHRKKNYGMCAKCWEENKDNQKVKEFAYINNFRIKRSAGWTDETYKKIKEIE